MDTWLLIGFIGGCVITWLMMRDDDDWPGNA